MKLDDVGGRFALLPFIGLLGTAFFPLLANTVAGDILYFVIAATSILVALWYIVWNILANRLPWLLIAGFLVIQLMGGAIQAATDDDGTFGQTASLADSAFVISYLFAICGLTLLVVRIRGKARTVGAIDASILLIGLMLVGWQFLLLPTLRQGNFDSLLDYPAQLRVWYPIGSYVVLALAVWISGSSRTHVRAFSFLQLGFVAWAIAESSFHLTSFSLKVPEWWEQALWLLSYVLISVGITHVGEGIPKADESNEDGEPSSRSGFLAVALCSIPAVMLSDVVIARNGVQVLVVAGCTLLSFMIWLRFNLLYRHLRNVSEALRKLSDMDPVSGAWNRRHFDETLRQMMSDTMSAPSLAILLLRLEDMPKNMPRSLQDRLLAATATALTSLALDGELVARVAEREFALIRLAPASDEELLATAWRIQNEMREILQQMEGAVDTPRASAYIGIACGPRDAGTPDDLLNCACLRASLAVESGNRVVGFNRGANT